MNVLVIGSGAREHALVWKLRNSPGIDRLYVAPGNGGTSRTATNLPVPIEDTELLLQIALQNSVDLTVVGPELPLAKGVVDLFRSHGLAIFGPTRQASRLEWSKAFARELMQERGIPSPNFKVYSNYSQAASFVERHEGPVVVKADGLAAGKGALVCDNRSQALAALRQCMLDRTFDAAGDTVVIEERLTGKEISVFAFCDGEHLSDMVAACDYKRALDGDQGPNTGGMGSYSPALAWTRELQAEVRDRIMLPVITAMAEKGIPYQGVLYAGLMLTDDGPKVLEFNCRLGDPEAQVILPLLQADLMDVLRACVEGHINKTPLDWATGACVGVVMSSGGYPEGYRKGFPVLGEEGVDPDVWVFHAGTRIDDRQGQVTPVTDGGRVLTVVACGENLAAARSKVYDNVGRITFQDAHYRTDIASMQKAYST